MTNNSGQASRPDLTLRVVGLVPIGGYIIAQVIVVAVWTRRVAEVGVAAKHELGEVLGSFVIVAVPTVLPALILGVLDGIAWARNQPSFIFARVLVVPTLLLLCVFWILPLGRIALGTDDFYGREVDTPSMSQHLAVLAGMELALAIALLSAILVRYVGRRLAP